MGNLRIWVLRGPDRSRSLKIGSSDLSSVLSHMRIRTVATQHTVRRFKGDEAFLQYIPFVVNTTINNLSHLVSLLALITSPQSSLSSIPRTNYLTDVLQFILPSVAETWQIHILPKVFGFCRISGVFPLWWREFSDPRSFPFGVPSIPQLLL